MLLCTHIEGDDHMSETATERLNRLLRILALGGRVSDQVLREAEQAAASAS